VEKEGSETPNTCFVILHLRTPRIPNSPANPRLYMFRGEKFGAWPLFNEKLDGYGVDENEIIVHFVGRGEDQAYAPLTMNSLTGVLRGHSLPTFRCQWTRGGLMIGNCMLRDGKESIWAKRWSGYAVLEEEQLDEW
jgi:hypothetical protein